jgi:hypothetical protein
MTHQIARAFELVAKLRARGELKFVARFRQRLDPRLGGTAPARARRLAPTTTKTSAAGSTPAACESSPARQVVARA